MKRRFFVILFAVVAFTCLALGLAACSGGNSPSGGAHSHDMEHYSAVEATCTESGNIEYWYCEGCGKYFSDAEGNYEVTDITVAAKGHIWGEWEVTKQATCEETGSQTRTCSVCNETETEEIPLAEHSYGEWQVTEKATCTEDGEQKRTCKVCGHEETETLSALGHTWGDWQIVEEATCKDGLRKHVCETCGAEEEEIIPASGEHKYIDTVIPPTVDEPGYTLHKCEICGEEYKDTYVDITFTEGLAYQLSADKEYYILTGIGDAIDTYLYLPASVNNKPVKEIAAKAFKDNTEITGVYIGSGVEVIGDSAFNGCTSLKDITLFDSIKEIGVGAFEDTAYYNNRDNWENSALYIGSCLIDVRETALGTLDIKVGTHIICAAAVADCVNILEVNIPDTVRYINRQAFAGCNTLEEVTVPSNVETMGVNAFYGCTSLKKLTIPFIGETAEDTTSPFGYLFGTVNDMTNFEAVPQSLTEVIVTGGETVADSAFYGLEKLTKIVLPETIKIIGEQAFSGCSNLVNFVIPANVESIGTEAFKDCAALTSVAVPENVTSIGLGAFGGCSKLESITMPFVGQNLDGTGETHFGYIFGAQSYSDNKNTVPESLKKVEITKAESIGNYAFYNCADITNVMLPETVKNIGEHAFYNSGLTSIVIPDSVTRIGSSAFSNCVSLTSITIPASVTRIGEEMFYNCRSLTSITIPEGVTNVGKRAFSNCVSLTSVTLGNGVTSIGESAFSGCSSLTGITIPEGVTSIGDSVFYGCGSLTSITIPSSVTSIGEEAFSGCSGLTGITIPEGVTSIGESAFRGCSGLTSITFAEGSKLTSIGEQAFSGCSSLTSITIPDSVTIIDSGAFSGCSSLESMTLPFVGGHSATSASKSTLFGCIFGTSRYTGVATKQYYSTSNSDYVTYYIPATLRSVTITGGNILYGAFYNCSRLTSITIPSSVTSIGSSAFYGCSGLTSITIPSSVTSISEEAFYNCSSLTSIYYQGDIASWCGISGLGKLMSSNRTLYINGQELTGDLVIPEGVTAISSYAFYGCSGLTSITIPSSVTSIGDGAFRYCSGLTIYCEAASKPSGWNSNWNSSNCPVVWDCKNNEVAADGAYYTIIDGIRYSLKDGVATVVGQPATISGDITIPATVTYKQVTYKVTSISEEAFYNCSSLTSITIPSSVTSIGDYAFWHCSSLTSISFAEGGKLTSIGGSAFSGCSSLTSITIPEGVTSIGEEAFFNCNSLTDITIPSSVTSLPAGLFRGCSSLESMTLPFVGGSVKTASDTYQYPFGYIFGTSSYTGGVSTKQSYYGSSTSSTTYDYYYIPATLRSVTITGGNILRGAFYNCSNLTDITIGDGVTSIGSYAFYYCSGLTSIVIPDSVTSIGNTAFSGCSRLTIYCEAASKPSGWSSDWNVFNCPVVWDCKNNEVAADGAYYTIIDGIRYSLKDGVATVVGQPATISGDITIPATVTYKQVTYKVTSISEEAFYNCSSLTSITIPSSVTSIGGYAFWHCSSLTSITIPDSVTSIGEAAFYGTAYYNNQANWQDDVLYIDNHLIKAEDTITGEYQIKDGTICIAPYAFSGCSSLTSIVIPDSVASIGKQAFSGCSNLTSIIIPSSVTSIGDYAFNGCGSLKSISLAEGSKLTSIGSYAFYNCSSLTSITIGDGVTSIGSCAFEGCSSLTSITIPEGVTSIGSSAFRGCTSLEAIYYYGTESDWAEISIGSYNDDLTAATRYYYSESQPTEDGNFWHYAEDGVTPVIWIKETTEP